MGDSDKDRDGSQEMAPTPRRVDDVVPEKRGASAPSGVLLRLPRSRHGSRGSMRMETFIGRGLRLEAHTMATTEENDRARKIVLDVGRLGHRRLRCGELPKSSGGRRAASELVAIAMACMRERALWSWRSERSTVRSADSVALHNKWMSPTHSVVPKLGL